MTADRLHLRAGPPSAAFDPAAGWLRHVRLGAADVLRAVYPAVRDRYWNTVPPRLSDPTIERGTDRFRSVFDAECVGGPDGTGPYRFDGAARSTFLRNRIGLCVPHPAECAGRPCTVEHPDATAEPGRSATSGR